MKLKEINSTLEFNLHRLNFIKLITQGAKLQLDALKYARNFTPFASSCKKEIQRLMGSLLYINSGIEDSPYSSLLDPGITFLGSLLFLIEDKFLFFRSMG